MILKIRFKGNYLDCLVDDNNYKIIKNENWSIQKGRNGNNYAVNSKGELMHRLILKLKKGDGVFCDHINGNGLDNRFCNLRKSNRSQNGANRKPSKNGTSKYLGVSWRKYPNGGGIWNAQITCNKKCYKIGYYKTEKEAAKAYDNMAIKLHGEFAKLNFNIS